MDAGPTLPKGLRFSSGKAALYAIQDYALFHRKRVKVGRRGGKHRRMVCSSSAACPFFVQLYMHNSKTDHSWYVSSSNLQHSADCNSVAKPTERQLVNSASFKQALSIAPNGTAKQLKEQLQGDTNLRTIYRAKQSMKRQLLNQLGTSYRKIPSLLRSFSELNDHSFTKYELQGPQSDNPGAFGRAFVSCKVFTAATAMNQQIYGLNCVPCANNEAKYQGVQLFLVGKDGNMKNVMIAAACCDAPTRENYRWFFQCVEESGVNLRYCPVLCAVDTELLGLEAELGLTFRYCTRYIIEHELPQLGGFNRHHHALVWGLQSSESEKEYTDRLEWIGTTCGPGVANYLRQIPTDRWVVAGNIDRVAMYGWRSRTFFESIEQEQQESAGEVRSTGLPLGMSALKTASRLAASAIAPNPEGLSVPTTEGVEPTGSKGLGLNRFRSILPFEFLEAVMTTFVRDAYERSVLGGKWKSLNRKVTQGAQELYDAQCRRIGEYKVSRASETVAFVTQMDKPPSHRRRVDLQASTCTCAFIDQFAMPCRHLIAVLLFCNQMDSVCDRFAACYLVDNYALSYHGKSVELPLDSALGEDPACAPPTSGLALGSVKTSVSSDSAPDADPLRKPKRPASEMEPATTPEQPAVDGVTAIEGDVQIGRIEADPESQRVRLCKKCRDAGHNARSCSYDPSVQVQQLI